MLEKAVVTISCVPGTSAISPWTFWPVTRQIEQNRAPALTRWSFFTLKRDEI